MTTRPTITDAAALTTLTADAVTAMNRTQLRELYRATFGSPRDRSILDRSSEMRNHLHEAMEFLALEGEPTPAQGALALGTEEEITLEEMMADAEAEAAPALVVEEEAPIFDGDEQAAFFSMQEDCESDPTPQIEGDDAQADAAADCESDDVIEAAPVRTRRANTTPSAERRGSKWNGLIAQWWEKNNGEEAILSEQDALSLGFPSSAVKYPAFWGNNPAGETAREMGFKVSLRKAPEGEGKILVLRKA